MKKAIYLALAVLLGCFLLGPWAWADEKKEETGAKVPKLMFKTDVGEEVLSFAQLKEGNRVAIATATRLFTYDKKGILAWQANFDQRFAGDLKVLDENKLLAQTGNSLHLFDTNGREIWSFVAGPTIYYTRVDHEGEYFTVTYLDSQRYPWLEVFKVDDSSVNTLWKKKLRNEPIPAEMEFYYPSAFFLEGHKRILLSIYELGFTVFDEKGNSLAQIDKGSICIDDIKDKIKSFLLLRNNAISKYDANGKEIITFNLPDNQKIDSEYLLYYNETAGIIYLKLYRKDAVAFLLNDTGAIFVKGQQIFFDDVIILSDGMVVTPGNTDQYSAVDKYDVKGNLLWRNEKPEIPLSSMVTNLKESYIALGLDNLGKNLDIDNLLIYGPRGEILWHGKLGGQDAFLGHNRAIGNYLPVVIDKRVFNYLDLKPILRQED